MTTTPEDKPREPRGDKLSQALQRDLRHVSNISLGASYSPEIRPMIDTGTKIMRVLERMLYDNPTFGSAHAETAILASLAIILASRIKASGRELDRESVMAELETFVPVIVTAPLEKTR